jgi:hypothetical protein
MADKIINIADLQREAKTYEPMLQTLPFSTLQEPLTALGINLVEVKDKNIFIAFERKGGSSRPYVAGALDFGDAEAGKVKERELKVYAAVLCLKDNVRNYKDYTVITGQKPTDNQAKEHPLGQTILTEVVKTMTEDTIDGMFHMVRNESDLSPMGMADGFFEQLQNDVDDGEISVAKGNQVNTGAIVEPASASDTDAIDQVVEFVQASDPKLRKLCNLMIDNQTLYYVLKALENKTINHQLITFQTLVDYLRSICLAPNLNVVTHSCLGTGGKLMLTLPFNMDLGLKTVTDLDFLQVRALYEDPNEVQFWGQFELGSRVRLINKKAFQMNEQTNTAVPLSGDYS